MLNKKCYYNSIEFNNNAVSFCAVIWGAAYKYFEKIIKEIGNQYYILNYGINDNIDNYNTFIDDIYSIDNLSNWKINIKKTKLMDNKHAAMGVVFNINNPQYRLSDRTGQSLSSACADLKRLIRDKYKNKVRDYIPDIIIHIADNENYSVEMEKVLKKYNVL